MFVGGFMTRSREETRLADGRKIKTVEEKELFSSTLRVPVLYACSPFLCPGIGKRELGIVFIIVNSEYAQCFDRRVMVPDIPKIQMHQDFTDHGRFLDKRDDLHGPLTFGTKQGIHMINLLDQPGPVLPKRAGCQNRFRTAPGQTPGAGPRSSDTGKSRPGHRA
jgi:hypothetical protein